MTEIWYIIHAIGAENLWIAGPDFAEVCFYQPVTFAVNFSVLLLCVSLCYVRCRSWGSSWDSSASGAPSFSDESWRE